MSIFTNFTNWFLKEDVEKSAKTELAFLRAMNRHFNTTITPETTIKDSMKQWTEILDKLPPRR